MAEQSSRRGRSVVVKSLRELTEEQLAGAHTFEVLSRPGGRAYRVGLSSERTSRRILRTLEALRAAGVIDALRARGPRSVGDGDKVCSR